MSKNTDLVIKNGIIVTASESYKADVAVKDGKITMISDGIESEGDMIVDAAGKLVLPGAIDAHVHLELPVSGTVSADSYEAGTRAAACGGTTMVFDFATQEKGMGLVEAVRGRLKHVEPQACIDYSFHVAITDLTPEVLDEFKDSIEFGVPSFKLYMVYKDMMVDDGVIADALERSKETGALIAVHAENPYLIDRRTKKLLSQGKTAPWYHYESRPEFVEVEAVRRVVYLAETLAAPLYIVHLASGEGLDAVTRARDEGFEIYAETCPQYLNFTNEVYRRDDGRYFVCSPSIKGEGSRKALWEGIKRGDISTIATDHCPFQSYEKDWGINDFTRIPNGCMGVENMYPYMLSEANKGRISFNKAVEVCSFNAAKIFGCAPQKGTIAVGSDADIVIYDPDKKFVVTKRNMHSDVDYTIWENYEMTGYPILTFSRGKLVFEEGKFTGKPGWGKFIKCFRR
ncbi:MAG TPA: dihydropyrimidinase [Bacillota bacterium]|nr:dihydropyrimidinase [Bacillota bacterium]HOR85256.1 dihydropyrimidinase [Bacillota bacterium]